MASFDIAFEWTLQWEDPAREYKQTPDNPPAGVQGPCWAISGVNSGAWPAEFAQIAAWTQTADRALAVKKFYLDHFWNEHLAALTSDDLAKRVFDAGVNMGAATAVRLLQQALGCHVDCVWGPATVNAANQGGDALVEAFKYARADHYYRIVWRHPDDARYLKGWLARAQA